MCLSSNSNIAFPCKICSTNIKDTDIAMQHLIQIDYKYLHGSNDLSFCVSWCNKIFLFGILTNEYFLLMVNSSPTTVKNNGALISIISLWH